MDKGLHDFVSALAGIAIYVLLQQIGWIPTLANTVPIDWNPPYKASGSK